ncbi:hypothetical protein AB6F64_21970 [Providencia hangzhouensis]|uniref:hypothetical protein n=1 Tax=Providencia TaxID=586 RepID=UPI001D7974E0|nr:hypothetical protein [Providencia sp. PROV258]EIU9513658.1 hypothetical protein [Providencia rettgeri]EJD6615556.1 hypothetical protein [Providencia rettgeri]ELR5267228.1 hypothetical protein [Providencia rettgeri]
MESMTFPILVIAIIFLGLALAGAIRTGEAKFGMGLAIIIIIMVFLYVIAFGGENKTEKISKGEYYSTQCQLIESNIDNGLFQSNTNKPKSGDVIEKVIVDEYQQAIQAYQGSGN